jgi:hypothetical protein
MTQALCQDCSKRGPTFVVRVHPPRGGQPQDKRLCLACMEALAGHDLPTFRKAAMAATSLLLLALTL